ncbi:MAG: SAM-dependent methyltransferase [Saprospiraceae bacterium]|nr:SAM-dependent methyltransferase [Saprospiraceae bacterium]MDZ4706572.1 SAM-dependent methyltransferase [Saprospiraceae bacterium]
MPTKGKLYLIPVPLGEEGGLHSIPAYTAEVLRQLDYFVVERAKTARYWIKKLNPERSLEPLSFYELNEHTQESELRGAMDVLLKGGNVGLLSEAGCPCVADPGAIMVAWAQRQGIAVIPLTGPSAMLMALMASGMNGQRFCFHGYLSPKRELLMKDLKMLEQRAARQQETQLFIETPYRNAMVFETALQALMAETLLCIAMDISLPGEYIVTKTITEWAESGMPDVHKHPAVFLIAVQNTQLKGKSESAHFNKKRK